MGKMEEEICCLLRRQFGCSCGLKPRYCSTVADLLNYVLEKCEEEAEGENKKRRVNPSTLPLPSIPKVLEATHYEKTSEVVPIKVEVSVKNCLRQIGGEQGVSSWIRELILEELRHIAEQDLEGSG